MNFRDPLMHPAKDVAVVGTFPLSATQERCWFLDQLEPGNPALNVAIRWTITGEIDAQSIADAYRAVIARHEILRTRFAWVNGQPVQEVMESAPFSLSQVDLRASPRTADQRRIDAIAIEDASKAFDLSSGPLIRAILIKVANDRAVLATTVHQICFDGWSIGILGREIGALAAGFTSNQAVNLPELPLQYADYSLWQKEYFASGAFAGELDFWRKKLDKPPYFEVAPDYTRPAQRTHNCSVVKADLPPAFGARIETEAKRRAMSSFAFGGAVLSAMLAQITGETDVLFGTQVAGRVDVDLEPLIGVFINNVVLRFAIDPDASLEAHLEHTKLTVREALAHQSVPFNRLVELVNPVRDPSRTPLISINYILQHAFMRTATHGRFTMASAPSHAPGAIYDLNFQLVGRPDGWRMTVEYNTDLFSEETAERLIELWQTAFAFFLEHKDAPVSALPVPPSLRRSVSCEFEALAPIETALGAHPLVQEAVAVSHVGLDGQRRTHAFVTPSDAATMALETLPGLLMAYLSATAPEEAIPDGVSVVRAMPRDMCGRVMRGRLNIPPLPARSAATPAHEPEAQDARVLAHVERVLTTIWADILGVENISPVSDFFDLGGHSLLSVRMLARIEQDLGVRPSLATVYRCPTLGALAGAVAAQLTSSVPPAPVEVAPVAPLPAPPTGDDADDWRIVRLAAGGPGVTVVAINNLGILQRLGATPAGARHLFAVRMFEPGKAHGLDGLDFRGIAARYIDVMRQEAPHGPYVLFGECVHGVLCYEIARQLELVGERVLLLATVNMWHPAYPASLSMRQRWMVRFSNIGQNFGLVRSGRKTFLQFLANYSITHRVGLWKAARALRLVRTIPPRVGTPEQEGFLRTILGARDSYAPLPSRLPVLQLMTPDSPSGHGFDATLGWTHTPTGPFRTVRVRPFASQPEQYPGLPAIEEVIADALRECDLAEHHGDAHEPH